MHAILNLDTPSGVASAIARFAVYGETGEVLCFYRTAASGMKLKSTALLTICRVARALGWIGVQAGNRENLFLGCGMPSCLGKHDGAPVAAPVAVRGTIRESRGSSDRGMTRKGRCPCARAGIGGRASSGQAHVPSWPQRTLPALRGYDATFPRQHGAYLRWYLGRPARAACALIDGIAEA